MKEFLYFYLLLMASAICVVLPIVLAWVLAPVWLLLLVATFPFAVGWFMAAIDVYKEA